MRFDLWVDRRSGSATLALDRDHFVRIFLQRTPTDMLEIVQLLDGFFYLGDFVARATVVAGDDSSSWLIRELRTAICTVQYMRVPDDRFVQVLARYRWRCVLEEDT